MDSHIVHIDRIATHSRHHLSPQRPAWNANCMPKCMDWSCDTSYTSQGSTRFNQESHDFKSHDVKSHDFKSHDVKSHDVRFQLHDFKIRFHDFEIDGVFDSPDLHFQSRP